MNLVDLFLLRQPIRPIPSIRAPSMFVCCCEIVKKEWYSVTLIHISSKCKNYGDIANDDSSILLECCLILKKCAICDWQIITIGWDNDVAWKFVEPIIKPIKVESDFYSHIFISGITHPALFQDIDNRIRSTHICVIVHSSMNTFYTKHHLNICSVAPCHLNRNAITLSR